MTKAQALAMNQRFLSMDSTIKAYNEAYKFKYFQYDQASKELAAKDSIVAELTRQLRAKPAYKEATKVDIFMASFFVGFSALMGYLVL
jgi:F0F1-type ATP synthase alpha subunit